MRLLTTVTTQMRVWYAYLQLSPDTAPPEREKAMETLAAAGSASLPCLRFALSQSQSPITQFAAAVVLHRLKEPQGLKTLTEALQWRLPTDPQIAAELEQAFLRIGAPDAVTALMEVWRQLPYSSDNRLALECMCNVWAALRDPQVLYPLIGAATQLPDLFLKTIPAFGEAAIPPLERMAGDKNPQRRILAAESLRRIGSGRAFAILAPMLRDESPEARAAIPAALEASGGPVSTARAITEALREGFSTREAVETLARLAPPDLEETLLTLIARWTPGARLPTGDTLRAVAAALTVLERSPRSNPRLMPAVCALLEKQPEVEIALAAARLITARPPSGDVTDTQTRAALTPLLAHPDSQVRQAAANALAHLGEKLGLEVVNLLQDCRPKESLIQKLRTLLRGGQDTGQAVNQALLQMGAWMARVSRETMEHMYAAGMSDPNAPRPGFDPRLPGLLKRLLENSLHKLQRVSTTDETPETLIVCVTALNALREIGAPAALCAREPILEALRTVKRNPVEGRGATAVTQKQPEREVADIVRAAAANTLISFYGKASFALLIEALYAPDEQVQGSVIPALGRLGDARALPHLQAIAARQEHPFQGAAGDAIALIKKINPEMMTLLRPASGADSQPETLLRPAQPGGESSRPELLLRPAPPGSATPGDAPA